MNKALIFVRFLFNVGASILLVSSGVYIGKGNAVMAVVCIAFAFIVGIIANGLAEVK